VRFLDHLSSAFGFPKFMLSFCKKEQNSVLSYTVMKEIGLMLQFFIFDIFLLMLQSLCHIYGGHSSHVTNVSFLHDDSRLISTGGRDTSVMQWALS
jgi:microtubule-associated protein-like 1/2